MTDPEQPVKADDVKTGPSKGRFKPEDPVDADDVSVGGIKREAAKEARLREEEREDRNR